MNPKSPLVSGSNHVAYNKAIQRSAKDAPADCCRYAGKFGVRVKNHGVFTLNLSLPDLLKSVIFVDKKPLVTCRRDAALQDHWYWVKFSSVSLAELRGSGSAKITGASWD